MMGWMAARGALGVDNRGVACCALLRIALFALRQPRLILVAVTYNFSRFV